MTSTPPHYSFPLFLPIGYTPTPLPRALKAVWVGLCYYCALWDVGLEHHGKFGKTMHSEWL